MKKLFTLFFIFSILILNGETFAKPAKKTPKAKKPVAKQVPVKPNFETKQNEIIETLNLDEKQKAKALELYQKTKDQIAKINLELKNSYAKKREIKMSKEDAREQLDKIVEINTQIDLLYQKRDKLHNKALKKFERILNKEQKEIWNAIKLKGVRLFPEMDGIN